MLTFNEACVIAYDYYAKKGFYGLRAAYDLGDRYGFMGNPDRVYYGGIVPITVSKSKGEIDQFLFFLPEVADVLKNVAEMDIPEEFKPNNKKEA